VKKFWICFLIISLFSLETKAQDEDFDVVQNEELGYVKLLEKPKCSNKELQKKIMQTVQIYMEQTPSDSTMDRRKKVLMLRSLDKFVSVPVSGFSPSTDYNTANALITIKINEHLKDEDIVLCQQEKKKGKSIYVLMYPYLDNYKGYIINLDENNSQYDAVSFIYP